MVSFVDAFIGTQQSKYAAVSILIAMIAISVSILMGADKIPLGQKFIFVLVILLVSVPSILYTLFQMSCIVTGSIGYSGNWWCGAYAWFLVVIVILYTFLVVIVSIMSIVNKKNMIATEDFYSNKEMYENAALEFIKEETEDANKKEAAQVAQEAQEAQAAQVAQEEFLIRGGASEPLNLSLLTGNVEAFQDSAFGGTPLSIPESKRPVPVAVGMPQ
jgi:hypothetical protein